MPRVKERVLQLAFTGGRNTKDDPLKLRPEQFLNDKNLDISADGVVIRRGGQKLFNDNAASDTILSQVVFTQGTTDFVLIHTKDGKIFHVPEGSDPHILIHTLNASATNSRFTVLSDNTVFFISDIDASNFILEKADVTANFTVRRLGIFAPGSWGNFAWGDDSWDFSVNITSEDLSSWGNFEWGIDPWGPEGVTGLQRYYISHVRRLDLTEPNEIQPESESPLSQVPGIGQDPLDFGNIGMKVKIPLPISSDSQVNTRRIYRKDLGTNINLNEGSFLIRLAGEVRDNTTTEFFDSLPFKSDVPGTKVLTTAIVLGDRRISDFELEQLQTNSDLELVRDHIGTLGHANVPPGHLMIQAPHRNNIIYAGNPAFKNALFDTKDTGDTRFRTLIDPNSFEGIRTVDGIITALAQSKDDLIIATERKIFRLRNFDFSDPFASPIIQLTNSFGIPDQKSVFDFEGRAMAFCTDFEVRFLDELEQNLGERVRPDLEGIPDADKPNVAIFKFKNKWLLAYRTSGSANTKVLVLHKYQEEFLSRFAWVLWEGVFADFFGLLVSTNRLISFTNGGHTSGKSEIVLQETGLQDFGANIPWQIGTADFHADSLEDFLELILIKHMIEHSGTLETEVFLDGAEAFREDLINVSGVATQQLNGNAAKDLTPLDAWGNLGWGDFPWGLDPIVKTLEYQNDRDCNKFSLILKETSKNQIRYHGSSIYVQNTKIT